ncbi:MAG: ligand-binding sensor domain-containing protein [Crocinitomix sp.]|jgi:ligand-binding sensor domain-containing protein
MKNVLFICLFVCSFGYGQIGSLHMGLESNLPSNSVYGICEDAEGRIWIGTDNGTAYLQDGYWKRYEGAGLPGMTLRVYAADDSGVYIVGNNPTGIYKLYPSGNFTELDHCPIGRFSGSMTTYCKKTQTIYYSDWLSLFYANDTGGERMGNAKKMGATTISTTKKGIPIFNGNKGVFLLENGQRKNVFNEKAFLSLELKGGELAIFSERHLLFMKDGLVTKKIGLKDKKIENPTNAVESYDGSIWFLGEYNGLFKAEKDKIIDVSEQLAVPHDQFTCIFLDSKKNMWCGTNGDGIFVIPLHEDVKNIGTADGLKDNNVRMINLIDESVIAVTKTGVHKIFDKNAILMLNMKLDNDPFPVSRITSIVPFDEFSYVFGTFRKDNAMVALTSYGKAIRASKLKWDGDWLLCGGWSYFDRIHRSELLNKKEIKVATDNGKLHDFGRTTGIEKVDSGYFFSTFEGIFFFDQKTEEITKSPFLTQPNSHFIGLGKTSDSTLWSASGNGIYKWDGAIFHLQYRIEKDQIGTAVILGSKMLTDFIVDPFDRLWLGTENGLLVVSENQIARFTTENGLRSNKINDLELNPRDSSIWVGTNRGLSQINLKNPKLFKKFEFTPFFSSIDVFNGASYNFGSQSGSKKNVIPQTVEINYYENNFRLSFSLVNYFGFSIPEYRYRILELGDDWIHTTETEIDFLALSPGNYTLEIEARSAGFYWSDSEKFQIIIDRPFWEKGLFYAGLSFILLVCFSFVYFLRIRKIRKQEIEKRSVLKKINKLELQALSAQMNPHFIFNSLNSIQHYLMPFKNENAINFIANLSKLIRLNMQVLGKKRVTLKGELERIELYIQLEKERYDKTLDFKIVLNLKHSTNEIWLPPMIMQPLVENAIWHGIMPLMEDGEIRIEITDTADLLEICIIDNGVGLSKKKSPLNGHVSKGTQLVRDRIKLHHPKNILTVQNRYDSHETIMGAQANIKLRLVTTSN